MIKPTQRKTTGNSTANSSHVFETSRSAKKKIWCPPAALPELLNGCNKRGWNMLKSPPLMLIFPTKAPLSMASSGIVQPHLTSGGDNEMKLVFPAGTLVKLLAPQKPWYVCYSSINRGKTIKNHPFGNGLVYTTYKNGDSGDGLLLFYPHDIQVCVFQQPLSLISHTMASPSQSVGAIEDHQVTSLDFGDKKGVPPQWQISWLTRL